MKKQCLILALLLITMIANAQMNTIYGAGYSFNFGQSAGLNELVNRYNQRTLKTPMGTFSPNGLTIGLLSRSNIGSPPLFEDVGPFTTDNVFNYLELGYSTYWETNSATFLGGTEDVQQDLRVRMQGVYLGGGSSQFAIQPISIAAGFRLNIGQLVISNRQGEISTLDEQEWNEAYNNLYVDMVLNMKFFIGNFVIEPYYAFGFDGVAEWEIFDGAGGSDISSVYQALGMGIGESEQYLKMRGFGLRLYLGIGFSDD